MASCIRRNAIVCRHCDDEIESSERRSPVWCKCRRVAVDGGNFELRRIGDKSDYIDVSNVLDLALTNTDTGSLSDRHDFFETWRHKWPQGSARW